MWGVPRKIPELLKKYTSVYRMVLNLRVIGVVPTNMEDVRLVGHASSCSIKQATK
jgi:hypothetical protein